MENQLYIGQVDEKTTRVESKKRDRKPEEASNKPSTLQKLRSRWARFVASLPEMPRVLDHPGFYHNETMTPDQVRQKVFIPDRNGFRY